MLLKCSKIACLEKWVISCSLNEQGAKSFVKLGINLKKTISATLRFQAHHSLRTDFSDNCVQYTGMYSKIHHNRSYAAFQIKFKEPFGKC
jgi:hypothetical protein